MADYEEPDDPDGIVAGDMTRPSPPPRADTSKPLGVFIVNWRDLPAPNTPGAWMRLRSWVEWFTVRYRISESTVPACWYKHGELVEELTALYTAHVALFSPADTGLGPITWHEHLNLARPRLSRAYSGGCARGHDPLKPRSWTDAVDEDEWSAWATTTHARGDT